MVKISNRVTSHERAEIQLKVHQPSKEAASVACFSHLEPSAIGRGSAILTFQIWFVKYEQSKTAQNSDQLGLQSRAKCNFKNAKSISENWNSCSDQKSHIFLIHKKQPSNFDKTHWVELSCHGFAWRIVQLNRDAFQQKASIFLVTEKPKVHRTSSTQCVWISVS